jgi:diacylglycerol kinase (ATP)
LETTTLSSGWKNLDQRVKTLFIINPISGRGKPAQSWPQLREIFEEAGWDFTAVFTERRGHAIELASEAARNGVEQVFAVGGDGLVNEVVNGLMRSGANPIPVLGTIPCGTGNDLARMLELPRDALAAAHHIAPTTRLRTIDLGECITLSEGQEQRRYFANDANLGFAAKVVERLERTGKFSRGSAPYFTALLLSALRHENHEVTLQWDDQNVTLPITTLLVCNCETTGGGMRVAPKALVDDGALDAVVIGALQPWEILWHAPKIYRGTHVQLSQVITPRVKQISISAPQPLTVVTDGELIGTTPARIRVLPAALRVRV